MAGQDLDVLGVTAEVVKEGATRRLYSWRSRRGATWAPAW
jgi:hypothetical protein